MEDAVIPTARETRAGGTHRIPEPVVDLDVHDAPDDLLAPVLSWFEEQQLGETETAQLAYARSITCWWIEGRRANVMVAGLAHYPPEADEPAESIFTTWSFALRRRTDGWQVRTWTSCAGEGPIPAWVGRWTAGRVLVR